MRTGIETSCAFALPSKPIPRSQTALPVIDLHRHLDGNLRLETVLELALEHDLELPALELEALRPHLQIVEPEADLAGFLGRVELMASVLSDYDACRRVTYENVEDARREGLDYVELRFSPGFMAHAHGLHPRGGRRSRV